MSHSEALAAEQDRVLASAWGGGKSPFAANWGKLMMWLFLISDALTFVALIAAYGFMRYVSPRWPAQAEIFDMRLIGFMTFTLISSSAVMAMAVGAARTHNPKLAVRFLFLTILGGLIFLGCQAYEWSHFIGEGARLWSNPWGVPQFSACFFVMTGFHGFHVTTGVIFLLVVALRAAAGRYSDEGVEIAGLYWHFIDVVWVFIFALFYLL
ncbi:MAG: cytochrome c oxidase subunit 3 [Acidobacteria bacterium]|nr:cytochrome c oxidase subunit 3 [Acidobacteriota bacterium]MBI3656122.1 cytochrome c oxidase subunit 3 [Acidobacteriota bacterium]